MPNEIKFIQCDCEEGKLEFLAQTKPHYFINTPTHTEYKKTDFYSCTNTQCNRIFSRNHSHQFFTETDEQGCIVGKAKCHHEDNYSQYFPYKGELTKEEIKKHAHDCVGEFSNFEEEKIIAKRKN